MAMSAAERQRLYRWRKQLAFWMFCDSVDLLKRQYGRYHYWLYGLDEYVGDTRPERIY